MSKKEEHKEISNCPVCSSKDIIQEYYSEPFTMHTPIGGPARPRYKVGSYCNNCGVKFAFNKGVINES